MPVLEADGKSLRICGDFKVIVNKWTKHQSLTITPFLRLKIFFLWHLLHKIGHKSGVPADQTTWWLQKVCCGQHTQGALTFAITDYSLVFPQHQDIPMCHGMSPQRHLRSCGLFRWHSSDRPFSRRTLNEVLQQLKDAKLKLKKRKYVFLADSVTYLGHRIDSQGLHPLEEKVKALKAVPHPKNVTEPKSYLGCYLIIQSFFQTCQLLYTSYSEKQFRGIGMTNSRKHLRNQNKCYHHHNF